MASEVDRPHPENGDSTNRSGSGSPAGDDPPTRSAPAGDRALVASDRSDIEVFPGLRAPEPTAPDPGTPSRVLAFALVLVGGLLGGLVGYGIGDLLWATATPAAALALAGAAAGAVGVGVLANLTLRAMAEWKAVEHPEADR